MLIIPIRCNTTYIYIYIYVYIYMFPIGYSLLGNYKELWWPVRSTQWPLYLGLAYLCEGFGGIVLAVRLLNYMTHSSIWFMSCWWLAQEGIHSKGNIIDLITPINIPYLLHVWNGSFNILDMQFYSCWVCWTQIGALNRRHNELVEWKTTSFV